MSNSEQLKEILQDIKDTNKAEVAELKKELTTELKKTEDIITRKLENDIRLLSETILNLEKTRLALTLAQGNESDCYIN